MLTHPTIDQLRALKLDGMADAFVELQAQDNAADLAHAEWLALLLDREAATRNTKRFQSRLRSARLRHGQASIEDVDYRTPRRLDKALFQQLAAGRWIAEHRNLLVTGPCGVGKSWLSRSLRSSRPCAGGNIGRAATTERPSAPHNTACRHPPRKRRSQPPSARSAVGRKRRALANVVSRPRSRPGRLEPRPPVASPSQDPIRITLV